MFKYAGIVLKKEMKDIFRDKKTIIMQILIPLLIFPIMAIVMTFVMGSMQKDMDTVSEVAIISNGNLNLENYLKKNKDSIKIVQSKDIEGDIKSNDVKAAIYIDKDFEKDIEEGRKGKIEIKYMDSSLKSAAAESKIRNIIDSYSKEITKKRLADRGIGEDILEPVETISKIVKSSENEESGAGLMVFSIVVPMILAIYAVTASIPAAVDLGAGEKERQTLEPLLTTKANRGSILLGKYLAVLLSSVIGTTASIIGLIISTIISPDIIGTTGGFNAKIGIFALILFLSLSLVFSGIELAISFYARNFKEAQTYLSPISVLVIIPAYMSAGIDAFSIPTKYFHMPIINIIVLFKEMIYGIYNPIHIGIVFTWIVIYIILSILFIINMFKSEKVIFRN
ncbi:MAG: ABC transporter permease [Andreesenia angusta]|nr:ABC transporter permease [Andreesenia angusta]